MNTGNEITNAERDALLIQEAQQRQEQAKSEKTEFTPEELHDALLRAEDTLMRAMADYVLLGETAREIKEDKTGYAKLHGNKVHLGMRQTAITKYFIETLKMLETTLEREDNKITFYHNSVPIVIDVVKNDMGFFERPDQAYYFVTNFPVPNPFDEYWENRDKLR